MNKKIVILLLTVVHWSITQAQFQDNFSDADFLTNPDWSGTQSKFIIENEQLRLLAPAESSSAYLTTGSAAIENASWEFYVKMDFNPSASNLTRVYLVSDQQNLDGNLSGYYVQLGGTDDEISLYRQSGATRTKIIDGQNGTLNFSGSQFRSGLPVMIPESGNCFQHLVIQTLLLKKVKYSTPHSHHLSFLECIVYIHRPDQLPFTLMILL